MNQREAALQEQPFDRTWCDRCGMLMRQGHHHKTRAEFAVVESARELAAVITRIGPHGPWEFRGDDRLRVCLALDHLKAAIAAYDSESVEGGGQ